MQELDYFGNKTEENFDVALYQISGVDVISRFSGFLEVPTFYNREISETKFGPETISPNDLERGKIKGSPVQIVDNESTDFDPKELLTVAEAADLFHVSPSTVWRIKESRKIRFFKIGACIRFLKSDLFSYLEKHRIEVIE